MAGAISAGAYTAGVMDYLLEALKNWEDAKHNARTSAIAPRVPMHEVRIDVLAGASAGGMTAGITAKALQQAIPHVTPEMRDKPNDKKGNLLYDSWVNLTDKGQGMMPQLLDTFDIKGDEAPSLLNAKFIETIASNALAKSVDKPVIRKYVRPDADLIMTLSNLTGIPYTTTFKQGATHAQHRMTDHRDFAHFKLGGGQHNNDGRMPLNFTTGSTQHTDTLKNAAMGTGAFPVGLALRKLTREKVFIEKHPILNHGSTKGAELDIPDPYHSLNADGGMMNNEPYDLALRYLLTDDPKEPAKSGESKDNRAILMIDPFPDEEDPCKKEKPKKPVEKSIVRTAMALLGAMMNQMRMKPEHIDSALGEKDIGLFLVAPTREYGVRDCLKKAVAKTYPHIKEDDVKETGGMALACGSLGGFGGFIDKSFREHDFYLGRRNCQRFLQKWFVMPLRGDDKDSPMFIAAYQDTDVRERFGYMELDENGKKVWYVPIIPDMKVAGFNGTEPVMASENVEHPMKNGFPKYEDRLDDLKPQINNRISAMLPMVADLLGMGVFALKALLFFKGGGSKLIIPKLRENLEAHNLIR